MPPPSHGPQKPMTADQVEEWLQAIDGKRYMTLDFETASTQVEIKIETSAGDIIIR